MICAFNCSKIGEYRPAYWSLCALMPMRIDAYALVLMRITPHKKFNDWPKPLPKPLAAVAAEATVAVIIINKTQWFFPTAIATFTGIGLTRPFSCFTPAPSLLLCLSCSWPAPHLQLLLLLLPERFSMRANIGQEGYNTSALLLPCSWLFQCVSKTQCHEIQKKFPPFEYMIKWFTSVGAS